MPPREKSKAADWVMVGLTVAVAIAAFWSACIFQSQLSEMHRATIIDQRVWIGLVAVEMETPEGVFSGPKLGFRFVNSGKTPASEVKTKLDWYFSTAMLPPVCQDVPRPTLVSPSIPPNGDYTLHAPSTIPSYQEDTASGIQYWEKPHEGMTFYCGNGEFSYRDIFSEDRHKTRFCVFARGGDPKKFEYCAYQNDMN
jgi:hypothetical protein